MRRLNRLLLLAIVLSVGLHLALVVGLPEFEFDRDGPPDDPPISARLQPAPPPPPEPAAAAPEPPRAAPPAPRRAPRAAPPPSSRPDESAASAVPAPSASEAVAAGPSAPDVAPPAPVPPASEPELPAAPAPPAHADYPVRSVRLAYDLLHGESRTRVGNVVHTFRSDGVRYEAESVAEAVGFVSLVFRGRFVQRSRGAIGPAGLVPEEYTLERGRGDPPERAVFDWTGGKLELAWRGEHRTVALSAGAQDPLSVLHQLWFMQPLPFTSQLAVASSRKLGRYAYEVLGDEDLITPIGLVRALHIGRVEEDGSVLEVWLDRDRDMLPARIYSRDRKGTVLDQVVREAAPAE